MTRTETRTQTDEWEVEVCENCGHDAGHHYEQPERVKFMDSVDYVAEGCMILWPFREKGGREIKNNPYKRCPCMKLI